MKKYFFALGLGLALTGSVQTTMASTSKTTEGDANLDNFNNFEGNVKKIMDRKIGNDNGPTDMGYCWNKNANEKIAFRMSSYQDALRTKPLGLSKLIADEMCKNLGEDIYAYGTTVKVFEDSENPEIQKELYGYTKKQSTQSTYGDGGLTRHVVCVQEPNVKEFEVMTIKGTKGGWTSKDDFSQGISKAKDACHNRQGRLLIDIYMTPTGEITPIVAQTGKTKKNEKNEYVILDARIQTEELRPSETGLSARWDSIKASAKA